MNIDDLREQLERMAGPAPHVTSDARRRVRTRVTSARRRRGAVSAISAVLVAGLVAIGVRNATESKEGVRTINSTTASTSATGPQCDLGLATAPTDQVPSDVAKWASDAPVVGGGELWAVRSILLGPENHDSAVYRMKVSWLTRPFGIPMFSGRRLDGPGTFQGHGNQATDARGEWVASTLEFSTPGCWEVTARYDQATITYRVLIGDPPQPLAMGTITGTLEEEGAGSPRGVRGAFRIENATTPTDPERLGGAQCIPLPDPPAAEASACVDPITGSTAANGSFSVDLPVGAYIVTGASPLYQAGSADACRATGSVVVARGRTTTVAVICGIR